MHSFYRAGASGENALVEMAVEALIEAGHEVQLFSKNTDDEQAKVAFSLRSGLRVATGRGDSPLRAIRQFKPDVVHIHNLFPNWSEHWIQSLDIPYVVTIHNFRRLCAAGTLLLGGKDCTLCPTKGSHHAIMNRCYRGSPTKSIPLAIATRAPQHDRFLREASRVIFISKKVEETHRKFGESSLAKKTILIPNFVSDLFDADEAIKVSKSMPWAFVGRLAPEKGIAELIAAWPEEEELILLGDGPLRQEIVEMSSGTKITFLGNVSRSQVASHLRKSKGLLFPSVWYEGGVPLAYLEALSLGVPIVAKAGNFVAEDILKSKSGTVFHSFSELPMALKQIKTNHNFFSTQAREHFLQNYSADSWVKKTVDAYREAILDHAERFG